MFAMDPYEVLSFNKPGKGVAAIFHTHILGDERPSDFDKKMSEHSCLGFLIYSRETKRFYLHEPDDKEYDHGDLSQIKKAITKFND
jgi:proteasome lid subunit RPN8/RPN11